MTNQSIKTDNTLIECPVCGQWANCYHEVRHSSKDYSIHRMTCCPCGIETGRRIGATTTEDAAWRTAVALQQAWIEEIEESN